MRTGLNVRKRKDGLYEDLYMKGRRIPFGTNAKLGVGCIISSSVTVDRGATVEDWSQIDTSGSVRIHGGEANNGEAAV